MTYRFCPGCGAELIKHTFVSIGFLDICLCRNCYDVREYLKKRKDKPAEPKIDPRSEYCHNPDCRVFSTIRDDSICWKCGSELKAIPPEPKSDRIGGISDDIKPLCPGCSRENDNKGRIMDGHQYCSRCAPKPAAESENKLFCPHCGADHSIWKGSIKCGKCQKFFPDDWPSPNSQPKPDRIAELREKHRHLPILLLKRDDIEDAQAKAELYNKKYNDAVADINELLDMLEAQPKERDEVLLALTAELATRQSSIERLKAELKAVDDQDEIIDEQNEIISELRSELKAVESATEDECEDEKLHRVRAYAELRGENKALRLILEKMTDKT